MTLASINPSPLSDLRTFVESQSGQKVLDCYQCGKCSAGCPAAEFMDLTPRQVMRAVQLGQAELALRSSTIWLCASCQTCSARCPDSPRHDGNSVFKSPPSRCAHPPMPRAGLQLGLVALGTDSQRSMSSKGTIR